MEHGIQRENAGNTKVTGLATSNNILRRRNELVYRHSCFVHWTSEKLLPHRPNCRIGESHKVEPFPGSIRAYKVRFSIRHMLLVRRRRHEVDICRWPSPPSADGSNGYLSGIETSLVKDPNANRFTQLQGPPRPSAVILIGCIGDCIRALQSSISSWQSRSCRAEHGAGIISHHWLQFKVQQ
jgi:hypothetical protein